MDLPYDTAKQFLGIYTKDRNRHLHINVSWSFMHSHEVIEPMWVSNHRGTEKERWFIYTTGSYVGHREGQKFYHLQSSDCNQRSL